MEKNSVKSTNSKRESRKEMLNAASIIGQKICNLSIWHENKCSWIGRTVDEISNRKMMVFALGSDIYSGTSGIALFLAYLYFFTKNELFRKHAEGAINQSISLLAEQYLKSVIHYGFYNGFVGIAYAAAKIGKLLNDNVLMDKSLEILVNLFRDRNNEARNNRETDIIAGNAGSILALLNLYLNIFPQKEIFDLAIFLGNELLLSAIKTNEGYSWNPEIVSMGRASHNLTGFAHGAAGIGYSLLELYNQTKNNEFLIGATNAFKYENYWFNKDLENWPDFRINPDFGHINRKKNYTYANAWCHGAPGIGLTRIRAYQLLRKGEYKKDLEASIRTSFKLITNQLEAWSVNNYSLCHGISGIGELLLLSDDILKSTYQDILLKMYQNANKKYNHMNEIWPCGIPNGETPDLMVGLAGIGYFYLRLYEPKKMPSIIFIIPDKSSY